MRTRESARHTKRANIRIISQTANLSPCFLGFLSVVSENGACQHLVSLPTCFRTAPASSLFCLSQKSAAGLSGPASSMRPGFPAEQEFRNKCPILQEVPPPGSYRLRRHFPRHCNFSTRVRHPYRPLFLRLTSGNRSPPSATGYAPSGCNDLMIHRIRGERLSALRPDSSPLRALRPEKRLTTNWPS